MKKKKKCKLEASKPTKFKKNFDSWNMFLRVQTKKKQQNWRWSRASQTGKREKFVKENKKKKKALFFWSCDWIILFFILQDDQSELTIFNILFVIYFLTYNFYNYHFRIVYFIYPFFYTFWVYLFVLNFFLVPSFRNIFYLFCTAFNFLFFPKY